MLKYEARLQISFFNTFGLLSYLIFSCAQGVVMKMNLKKKISILFFLLLTAIVFAASSNTVYVTKTGKKYHQRSCKTLSKSKTVIPMSINDAKNKGYTPCKVCNP